jgi:hypothetical protein
MSTQQPRQWTSADLELYHDDELAADERAALTEALRHDAGLRRELLAIQRADHVARAALLSAVRQPVRRRRAWPTALGMTLPVAAAASLLLAFTLWRSSANSDRVEPAAPPPASGSYQAIRFVTLGTGPRPQPAGPIAAMPPVAPHAPESSTAAFLNHLDRTLVRGDVDEALRLLADAPVDRQTLGYRRLGEVVRSTSTAKQILDRLTTHEQLTVCATWARNPELRSVVYPRLRQLGRHVDLEADVTRLVSNLAEEPALRDVLRSYQLLRPTY